MELYKKLLRRMWCDNGRRPLLIVYGGVFMSIKKLVPTVLVLSLILWYLYPVRQGDVDTDANVVETMYMAPGGPVKGAMDDAVREFERRSLEDHEADSTMPIYRVISGQNAAREKVADPTRFLVSVAGEVPGGRLPIHFYTQVAICQASSHKRAGQYFGLDH